MNANADSEGKVRDSDVAFEATVSMAYANAVALALLLVAILVFVLPLRLIPADGGSRLQLPGGLFGALVLIVFLILEIVFHELLHALGFVLAGKVPVSTITFGVLWRALAPYAHCRVAMKVSAYRIAVALPGLLLGLVPGLLAVLFSSHWLAYLGAFMMAAAGGDLAVLLAVRNLPKDTLVRDHPSRPGCLVLKEKPYELDAE